MSKIIHGSIKHFVRGREGTERKIRTKKYREEMAF